MAKSTRQKQLVRFTMRLPKALRDRLERAAARNQKSMTLEILARLELTFTRESQTADEVESVNASVNEHLKEALSPLIRQGIEEAFKKRANDK